MSKIRSMLATQSSVEEPERRGDERSEAARSRGSFTLEPDAVPVPPDSEVPARHARRRFTTAYKLATLSAAVKFRAVMRWCAGPDARWRRGLSRR